VPPGAPGRGARRAKGDLQIALPAAGPQREQLLLRGIGPDQVVLVDARLLLHRVVRAGTIANRRRGRRRRRRECAAEVVHGHAARHAQGLALLQQEDQVVPLAFLAQHVHGQHLGRWAEGLAFQQRLAALPLVAQGSATAQSLQRFAAVMKLASATTG